jgi:type III secretion protein T
METADATVALIKAAYPYLLASGLAVARALGVVLITPAFTRLGVTGLLRSCIAVAVAVPAVPPILDAIAPVQGLSPLTVAGLMIKEVVVGGVIGFVFGVPFWAAETAGDIVDLQRGSSASQLLDPIALAESSVSATFLTLAMLALFFTTGGFALLADAIYRSYELWPATRFTPVFDSSAALVALKTLDRIMQIAVLLVAPIMVALLAADLMLGYLSRLAPQIHVFDLSLSVKNLLFTFMMVVYAVFLAPAMLTEVGALRGAFDLVRDFAAGGATP